MKRLGAAVLFAVLVACSAPPDAGTMLSSVPNFTLTDVNPNSSRSGQSLSPGSFASKVTGWYFGHSS